MIQIDMPMPKNCADCCFATADLVNGTITLFCMTPAGRKMYAPDLIGRTTRPEWCPLKEQEAEARLLTAEEVQNMEAGTAFGIETYYDHDGERVPGCTWALRTESLILSYFGTMFPDTVTKIPYNTLEKNQNTGKQEKHQYRFWSKKPTFEQCKAVKLE